MTDADQPGREVRDGVGDPDATSPPETPDGTPAEQSPDPFAGAEWPKAPLALGAPVAGEAADRPHRRRRVSRRRLRRRRRIGWAMLLLGLAILFVGAWIVVTGLLARSALHDVRADASLLRTEIAAGDLPAARTTATHLAGRARRSHELTTGPFWALASAVPGSGNPVTTLRAITGQLATLSDQVLPQLIDASVQLDPSTLRRPDGSVDLARIAAAAPSLDRASATMSTVTAAIAAQPAHTWLHPVDSARGDLLTQLTSLGRSVRSADLAARIAPALLGQHGTRRYFVGFQNEAESRGTGGLPGAFAILRVDDGTLSFERFESDSTLDGVRTGLSFGAMFQQLYGAAGPADLYANSDISPHFPYAAQIWMAMWRTYSGQRLDGAIAVDPTMLSYLLQVTGPATLPDGTTVSAQNVVALTESTVYAKFPVPSGPDQVKRKQYLLGIARAVSGKLLDSRASTTSLVKAAARAAGERRLLVYSSDRQVERELEQTSLSGAIPATKSPYAGVVVVNEAATKLDYYLDRSLTWQRTDCGRGGAVTATIRLTNDAPASGLSRYVDTRADAHSYPVRPGDNRLAVSYYATADSGLAEATLDGRRVDFTAATVFGHPVFTFDVELPRGATRTLVLHLREPQSSGSPTILDQPLVRPMQVSIRDASCG